MIEQNIIENYNQKLSVAKIAIKFHMAKKTVLKILKKNNIEIRRKKIVNKLDVIEIIRLYVEEKMNGNKIAKLFNIKNSSLHKLLIRNEIKTRSNSENYEEKNNSIKNIDLEKNLIRLYLSNPKLEVKDIMNIIGVKSDAKFYEILKRNNINLRVEKLSLEIKESIKYNFFIKMSIDNIADLLNVSCTSVLKTLHDLNIEIHRGISKDMERKIINMYSEFKNAHDISSFLNTNPTTVINILNRNGIKVRGISQARKRINDEEYAKFVEKIPEYMKYRTVVDKLTKRQNIKLFPNYEKRGKAGLIGAYHLDHKYSIVEGFLNNINPDIIANKENLEFITWEENNLKGRKCSITIEKLYLKIKQNEK